MWAAEMRAMQGAGGGASLPEPTQCGSDGGPAGSEGDDLEAVFNGSPFWPGLS